MSQVSVLPPRERTASGLPPQTGNSRALILQTACVLLLAQAPMLFHLGVTMWARDHYQFFPLAFAGAGYLLYARRDLLSQTSAPATVLVALLWTGATLTFALGVLINSPWLVGASAFACLGSGAYSLGGSAWLKRLFPVGLLLLIAFPLPSQYDVKLINWLQRCVSEWASGTFDLLGYPHNLDGVDLTFPRQSFEVEEACSGIHSFFAALCCTVFYLAAGRRSVIRYLYLIPAAVFWVLVANVVRILLVVLLSMEWQLPVIEGFAHAAFGAFVFAFSLAMIYSTDCLFLFFFPRKATEGIPAASRDADSEPVTIAGIVAALPRFTSRQTSAAVALMVLFGGLGGLSVVRGNVTPDQLNLSWNEDDFRKVDPAVLSRDWKGWTFREFNERHRDFWNPLGTYSQQWTFEKGSTAVTVSLDSPFVEWHDLGICYRNIGWTVNSEDDFKDPEAGLSPVHGSELAMSRADGRFQHVYFSAFDAENKSLPAPALYRTTVTRRIWQELTSVGDLFGTTDNSISGAVYQIQLVVTSRSPIGDAQRRECLEFFRHVRRTISGR